MEDGRSYDTFFGDFALYALDDGERRDDLCIYIYLLCTFMRCSSESLKFPSRRQVYSSPKKRSWGGLHMDLLEVVGRRFPSIVWAAGHSQPAVSLQYSHMHRAKHLTNTLRPNTVALFMTECPACAKVVSEWQTRHSSLWNLVAKSLFASPDKADSLPSLSYLPLIEDRHWRPYGRISKILLLRQSVSTRH